MVLNLKYGILSTQKAKINYFSIMCCLLSEMYEYLEKYFFIVDTVFHNLLVLNMYVILLYIYDIQPVYFPLLLLSTGNQKYRFWYTIDLTIAPFLSLTFALEVIFICSWYCSTSRPPSTYIFLICRGFNFFFVCSLANCW